MTIKRSIFAKSLGDRLFHQRVVPDRRMAEETKRLDKELTYMEDQEYPLEEFPISDTMYDY